MHSARLTSAILIGVAILVIIAGLIYGAVTTTASVDWAVSWSFPIVAAVLVVAALGCLLVWRRGR